MKKRYSLALVLMAILGFSANLCAIPIAGSSTGVFTNPSGPSGMIVTGEGTSNFAWGDNCCWGTEQSSLSFAGNVFDLETDQTLSFGTLTYYNGTISSGSQADSIDLKVNVLLTTPAGIDQDFTYNLMLIGTPNTGSTPAENADIVQFDTVHPSNFFAVGGVNYTLEFLGVGSIVGDGYTTVDSFHVYEDASASGELLGRFTANFPDNPNPVPEPTTLLLMCLGLAGIGYQRRRLAT